MLCSIRFNLSTPGERQGVILQRTNGDAVSTRFADGSEHYYVLDSVVSVSVSGLLLMQRIGRVSPGQHRPL